MKRGFTLIELIIVLLIIGVLATLAIPQITVSQERARCREAIANLRLIAAAERTYLLELDSYFPHPSAAIPSGTETDVGTIDSMLKLSLNEDNWDYVVTSDNTNLTLTATATRLTGRFSNCVFQIQITSNNPEAEPAPVISANCPP